MSNNNSYLGTTGNILMLFLESEIDDIRKIEIICNIPNQISIKNIQDTIVRTKISEISQNIPYGQSSKELKNKLLENLISFDKQNNSNQLKQKIGIDIVIVENIWRIIVMTIIENIPNIPNDSAITIANNILNNIYISANKKVGGLK